jgi:fatty acid/phospholipid biosynthesis enzyme
MVLVSNKLPKRFGNPCGKIVLMTKTKIKSHKQSSNKKNSIMHIEKCVQTDERQQALMKSSSSSSLLLLLS